MSRTAQRIEELASFASVHLDQAVKACRVKAGQYGFLPRHEAPPTPSEDTVFQARAGDWVGACFGDVVAGDKVERNHRFLEEALELVQACGGAGAARRRYRTERDSCPSGGPARDPTPGAHASTQGPKGAHK